MYSSKRRFKTRTLITRPLQLTNASGGTAGFLTKYDNSGLSQWALRVGGDAGGGDGFLRSSASDSNGNVYAAGLYNTNTITLYNADGSTFTTLAGQSGLGYGILVQYNTGGIARWVARFGGSGSNGCNSGKTIAIDSIGNVYISVYYRASPLTIYNSDGTTFGTLANAGGLDGGLIKYNSSGMVQWATRWGNLGNEEGYGISCDSTGNVYVTGYYTSNPITFYNSDGSAFGTTLANAGGNDGFLAKYNSTGAVQWVTRVAGTLADTVFFMSVSSDSTGNAYILSDYQSNPLTIYNSDGSTFGTLPKSGVTNAYNAYIVKYNSSGVAQWATRIAGNSGGDYLIGISAIDSNGIFYVSGQYQSQPVTFYNSDGSAFGTTLASSGSFDAFLAKYDSSGMVQWIAKFASSDYDSGRSVSIDSNGNAYVCGYYTSNPITFYNSDGSAFATTLANSGAEDGFLVKYSSSGGVQWAKRIAAGPANDQVRSAATDPNGNVYMAGYFASTTLTVE